MIEAEAVRWRLGSAFDPLNLMGDGRPDLQELLFGEPWVGIFRRATDRLDDRVLVVRHDVTHIRLNGLQGLGHVLPQRKRKKVNRIQTEYLRQRRHLLDGYLRKALLEHRDQVRSGVPESRSDFPLGFFARVDLCR